MPVKWPIDRRNLAHKQMEVVTYRMTKDHKSRLEEAARNCRMSINEFIHRAVLSQLDAKTENDTGVENGG